MTDTSLTNFSPKMRRFLATAMKKRNRDRYYSFEGKPLGAIVSTGLACIERFGVPNGI